MMNFKSLFGREIVIANRTFHNMQLCFFIIIFFVYVMLKTRRHPQTGEVLQFILHNASSHKWYITYIRMAYQSSNSNKPNSQVK